ncbi:MAG: restriction endonuclease [Candidatus Shapirobacteria bacterium]
MRQITVIKWDGRKEPYEQNKVVASLVRSGVGQADLGKLLGEIEGELTDPITTKRLFEIVDNILGLYKLEKPREQYHLRDKLAVMDPFEFEKFIQKILEEEGYQCEGNVVVPGFWVEHQIDVVAQKGDKVVMVEVKHHDNPHRLTGLGDACELWARLEDLEHGYRESKNPYNFNQAWLVVNTKFSEHAIRYAKGKNLWLTGWRYQLKDGIEVRDGLEKQIEKDLI